MSQGARNCPFLMFTVFPVRPAATRRSVCRHRNAGIWRMSSTLAAGSACSGSWMSDRTGTPAARLTASRMRSPSFMPGPRNERTEERFALSKEALKTYGTPIFRHTAARACAMRTACASLSMTQGPARNASGAPPPIARSAVTATRRPAGGGSAGGLAVPLAGIDEGAEEGVRLHRLALELRVELAGQEVGMVGDLDDLDEALVGGLAGHLEAAPLEVVHVLAVHLVPVPVALADLGARVRL